MLYATTFCGDAQGQPEREVVPGTVTNSEYCHTSHASLYVPVSLYPPCPPVQFVAMLKDNLNAEVVLGTVTNLREACTWLSYTYLYVRMQANPLHYGMTWQDVSARFSTPNPSGCDLLWAWVLGFRI